MFGEIGVYNSSEELMKQQKRVNPTVTESLEARKQFFEDGLRRTNEALEALKKNPELENLFNLIQKATY